MYKTLFGLFSFLKKTKPTTWQEANHVAIRYADTAQNDILAQQLFLATHYSIVNGMNVDQLQVESINNTNEKSGWKDSWGVTDHDSAIENLKWLQIEGHRMSMYEIISIFNSDNFDNLTDEASSLINLLKEAKTKLNIEGQMPNIGAWDYARLVNNCRAFHSFGYLSKEEAAYYLNAAQDMARKEYKSWEEYSLGFLIGRTVWAEEMDEQFAEIHQNLMTDPESPYVRFDF